MKKSFTSSFMTCIKTSWIRQVILCHSHALSPAGAGFLGQAKGSKAFSVLTAHRRLTLGPAGSRVYCQPFKKAKGSITTDGASDASSSRPLAGRSPSALSVSSSVQTARLRCRGVRLAPLTAGPGVTTCHRPRFKVTSWRCRRARPPSPRAPPRGRGLSTGSLREGAGPRAPGALTRSMKVRNFQLPP